MGLYDFFGTLEDFQDENFTETILPEFLSSTDTHLYSRDEFMQKRNMYFVINDAIRATEAFVEHDIAVYVNAFRALMETEQMEAEYYDLCTPIPCQVTSKESLYSIAITVGAYAGTVWAVVVGVCAYIYQTCFMKKLSELGKLAKAAAKGQIGVGDPQTMLKLVEELEKMKAQVKELERLELESSSE